jgi:hypothetical protein
MYQQYKNYTCVALVGHLDKDLATYRERALQVAEYGQRWNMTYHEIRGSDEYVRRLVEVSPSLSKADSAFQVVAPGGKIDG